VLSAALGLLYIISGVLKLLPIEYLENDILRTGLSNENLVLFQSRLIVGSEFVIGGLLICCLALKKTIRLSFLFLLIYSVYLFWLMAERGNEANCGCFGQDLQMTPLQGLIKNVSIGLLSFWLLRQSPAVVHSKRQKILIAAIMVLGIVAPFVLYKIDFPEKTIVDGQEVQEIKLHLLYEGSADIPMPWDLRKGKVIIMFGSLTCEQCIMTMHKLEVIKQQYPELPIYAILNGDLENFDAFQKATQLKNIPHTIFNGGETLVRVCGNQFPRVFLVEDSYILSVLNYPELNGENMVAFFR
jgi:hypothetical protein